MDELLNGTSGQNAALLVLAFLQADCRNSAYRKELLSLGNDLNLTQDINCNGRRLEPLDDGDLETDGHLPISISLSLHDIQPSVELRWPRNHAEAAELQEVVEGLREIAAIVEQDVVAQATRNLLSHNKSPSPSAQWKTHLCGEVERLMRQGVGLEHLPQERVYVALALTLVKGVCEQAPQFLRSLFNAALQFFSPDRAR